MVASVGVGGSLACFGGNGPDSVPVGNLMPPPATELCIEVEPDVAGATVTLDGLARSEGCESTYAWEPALAVTAPGYETHTETVQLHGSERVEVKVSLERAVPIPVGNLMAPPPMDER